VYVEDLVGLTSQLISINSVSGNETEIADFIYNYLCKISHLTLERHNNTVIATNSSNKAKKIILAGHIDTVPANGNERPQISGNTIKGLGSVDMKGGIAVMIKLAELLTTSKYDTQYIFYESEEIEREKNGLFILKNTLPEYLAADAAVLLEPTNCIIEAGCQGIVQFQLQIKGKRAHSARPWMGHNAIYRSANIIEALRNYPKRDIEIDGCKFKESLQAVIINGGIATNVIPDLVELTASLRFAPDLNLEDAVSELNSYFEPILDKELGDSFRVIDTHPPAKPSLSDPAVNDLMNLIKEPAKAKLGWTDVALFAELGVPAINYGPGDSTLAHSKNEELETDQLDKAYNTLFKWLNG
jgi:succinyl-diaminopimelate desuccinylase